MYFPCVVYYSSWQKVMKFGKMPINESSFNPRVSPGTIFEGIQVSLGGCMLFCQKAIVGIMSVGLLLLMYVTRYRKRGISVQIFEISLAVPCESVLSKQYDGPNPLFVEHSCSMF